VSYTPGPWQAHGEHWSLYVIGNIDGPIDANDMNYSPVCDVSDTDDADANVRLICAAPDLLAALQAIVESVPFSHSHEQTKRRALDAIANATGAA
jgi:hypothetical protein